MLDQHINSQYKNSTNNGFKFPRGSISTDSESSIQSLEGINIYKLSAQNLKARLGKTKNVPFFRKRTYSKGFKKKQQNLFTKMGFKSKKDIFLKQFNSGLQPSLVDRNPDTVLNTARESGTCVMKANKTMERFNLGFRKYDISERVHKILNTVMVPDASMNDVNKTVKQLSLKNRKNTTMLKTSFGSKRRDTKREDISLGNNRYAIKPGFSFYFGSKNGLSSNRSTHFLNLLKNKSNKFNNGIHFSKRSNYSFEHSSREKTAKKKTTFFVSKGFGSETKRHFVKTKKQKKQFVKIKSCLFLPKKSRLLMSPQIKQSTFFVLRGESKSKSVQRKKGERSNQCDIVNKIPFYGERKNRRKFISGRKWRS